MKTHKNNASIMFLWTTSGVSETAKVSKYLLNLIFVSVTYYHLSNLVKVEQILMVKIMVTIFPSKERHKWLSKRSHKKQTEQTFPFGSLNFFFPIQFQMFAFSVLQFFPQISQVVLWIYWDVSCIYWHL